MRNREVQIKFYTTEKERESIRRNAKRAGMKMGEYARAVLTSDDVSIKVIDTEPLKKAAHELAKQGTNLNQFMKFLNTYGVKVFDPDEAKRVLEKEVSTFSEIMEALAALRRKPTGTMSICKSRTLTTSITNDRRYGNDLPRNVFALHHDGIISACY